jgi:hypothetical protein
MRMFLKLFLILGFSLLVGCDKSEVLSAEPTALDLDVSAATCPGLVSLSVTSGPSLTMTWTQATDDVTPASAMNYLIFMKTGSGSYDLVSPSKIVIGATTTSITSGVQLGQTYTLFVSCKDEKGNQAPAGPTNEKTVTVSDATPPTAITDLAVTNPDFTSLNLTWSPADDGAGGTTSSQMVYKIYRSTSASVSTAGTPIATQTGSTSRTDTGLTPNVTYYYRVVAVDLALNASSDSNESSNTTLNDTTAPTLSPSGLAAGAITASTVPLTWNAGSDNVTAAGSLVYNVHRCSGSTTCDPFASAVLTTTAAGVTAYTDTGLSASTIYVYGVRARDGASNISTNTDKVVTSTSYSSTGSFFVYPTQTEIDIRFGQSVAVANVIGTASGAGAYPDLIVGAPNASEPGAAYVNTGCIFIFAGTATGTFSLTPSQIVCQPNATANGNNNRNFGYNIAAGDLDDDGNSDLVVTSPQQDKFFIFRSILSAGSLSIGSISTSITNAVSSTTLGYGLCLGNSNNIGATDIFITATYQNCSVACGGRTGTGNMLVYNNTSVGGSFSIPSYTYSISPTQNYVTAGYTITNNESVARSCVFGKFDPDNAAEDQLVIGSGQVAFGGINDGAIAFYRKTAANTFTFQNILPTGTPAVTGSFWADSLGAAKLVSTDTTLALLVGAPLDSQFGTSSGAVFSYEVATPTASTFALTDIGVTYTGGSDQNNNGAGSGIATADIWKRGDGTHDIVVGSYLDDKSLVAGASAIDIGDVFTYRNVAGSIPSNIQQQNFDVSSLNPKTNIQMGRALCSGDVNNDGITDVIAGAPASSFDSTNLTNGANAGAVYIYNGVSSGEIDFANPSQIIFSPGALANSSFGNSCVVMDYNGDSKWDLVVGSPYRDTAGTDRGGVFTYYGATSTALSSIPSATLPSPVAVNSTLFGFSLAKGDLDNNGYDDLIVGGIGVAGVTPTLANQGRVFVYWADSSNSHAILTASPTTIVPAKAAFGSGTNPYLTNTPNNTADMYFGYSVAVFPTVLNSTGKDLVVCSPTYDSANTEFDASQPARTDIGHCWIYEGKVNGGLVGNYQIMSMPKNEIRYPYPMTGYSANTQYFGYSQTVGDWDNDGTDDLVICGALQRNLPAATNNAGGCFAFLGKNTAGVKGGFNTTTAYRSNSSGTRNIPVPDTAYYNTNYEASATYFGASVILVDVNNNNRADLIVGEHQANNTGGPSNLGYLSGRIFIKRGGF